MANEAGPYEKLKKLISKTDQMLSQHSYLRDNFRLKANVVDLTIMLLSLILAVIVFSDPKLLKTLFPSEFTPKIVMGLFSLGVLFLSIINWKIDWKQMGNTHELTCNILSDLKFQLKSYFSLKEELNEEIYQKAEKDYRSSLARCCNIPEKKFHQTKLHHNKKVALSKAIDDSPSTYLWIIKLKLWCGDTFKK